MASRVQGRPLRAVDALLLGAALVAGWVLHDFAVFLARVHPRAVFELLPGSGLVILAGALGGLAALRWRVLLALDLVLLALLLFLIRRPGDISQAAHWLPRALLLLLAALNAARALCGRRLAGALSPLRAGLCFGIIAGVTLRQMRQGVPAESAALLAAALVALALGFAPRASARWIGSALAVLACVVLVWRQGEARRTMLRPDLAPPTAPPAAGPNLLFIVLDTVAATHLAPYGYARATTPRLDRFAAEEATLYADARSTSSWTLPAHASLFTGLLPGEHGATHLRAPPGAERRSYWPARPLREDATTLAELLRERGYRTGAIVANGTALRHGFKLDQGFEHYDDRRGGWLQKHLALAQLAGFSLRSGHYPYRDARDITGLALDWLAAERRAEEPFFLFLNFMDAHWPYQPPAPFDRAFEDAQPRDPLAPERELHALLYDRALGYLDAELGRLLDAVRERGLWDDTAIVITSDHGEAFGEHGFWRHDFALYEELIRVPLYVKPAGGRRAERVETRMTGADVHGVTLELLGLPTEAHARDLPVVAEWYQQDLAAVGEWEQLFSAVDLERDLISWIDGHRKWIVSSRGEVEVYDLDRDPGERTPLPLSPAEIEEARRRAQEWWANHIPPTVELEALEAEERAQLEALGYVGGGKE